MVLRDYTQLMDKYFVNEKEYYRLIQEECPNWEEYEIWDLPYKSMSIHKSLNGLFKDNSFIYKLLMTSAYSNIIPKNERGYVGGYNMFDFDHSLSLQLKEDTVRCSDTITGILAFPYLSWSQVREWVGKAPQEYQVYIINPVLIIYNIGAVGMFLTINFYDGAYIELFNHYSISQCGLPLFLTFTEEPVEPIHTVNLPCGVEDFIDELNNDKKDKSLRKLLNFWKDHEEIHCEVLEEEYEKFKHLQSYGIYTSNINYLRLTSKVPFTVVHEDTGEVLGEYYSFSLDAIFKVIDTDKGTQELTDNEVDDLLDGKYDFKIIGG